MDADPARHRCLLASVRQALADTPAVFIAGPRQAGKTTLCRALAQERRAFLTLDDGQTLAAALADPDGFVASIAGPAVIDEVQRAPDLFRALKFSIDRDRRPGRFLLTGSTSVLALPRAAESLAGRMEILHLWSFSQGEIGRRCDRFLDRVFDAGPPAPARAVDTRAELIERVCCGGYPEVQGRLSHARRRAWFASYLTAVIQRDIRDLAQIDRAAALPLLLAAFATRAASMLNVADLSRSLGLPQTTLQRYVGLLEAVGLIRLIPAWAKSARARLMKAPRVVVTDTGLACHLANLDADRFRQDPGSFGPVLENFVAMELIRQTSWAARATRVHHLRSYAGREVDFVLEAENGDVVGIEVKAGQVGAGDFTGLRTLADLAGARFKKGLVLYAGKDVLPFGKHLWAVPISALWN